MRDAIALQGGILAVIDDRRVQHPCVLEGSPHQQCCRHWPAVVRKRDAPGRALLAELRKLLATRAERNCADRVDTRQPGLCGLLQNELRDPGVIVDRVGVGHAGDGREAARHRRGRSGRDRLLVLLTRLAQMHVHIDETGDDEPPARDVEHLGAIDRQVATDSCDAPVFDQDVERAVALSGRIDDASPLQQQLHDSSS
jgi:hypothetical protein